MPSKRARTGEKQAQAEQGVLVRDIIARHFLQITREDGRGKNYLTRLANEHPSSYVALINRICPQVQQVNVAVEHHAIDLGQAMLEASQRLAAAQATLNMIDVTPATSDLSPDTSDVVRDTSDV